MRYLTICCLLIVLFLGFQTANNNRETIKNLSEAVEFYQRRQRQVIYQDVGHARKVHSFSLSASAMTGSDKILLYTMSFQHPLIVKVGYELCVDFNQIGTY